MSNKNTIVIIGKPNVGKSTLFNRIIGKSHSIVSEQEGVTRDRIKSSFIWNGQNYDIIDTGGYISKSKKVMDLEVNIQSDIAKNESDLILLLMDVKQEITANDRDLAQSILKLNKPYLFILNKVDNDRLLSNKNNFYELGLNDPIMISSQTGKNIGDLLDRIHGSLSAKKNNDKLHDFSIAIIGTPNVGKSSLINKIMNKNLSIVTDIAGTTRDSVDSSINYFNHRIRLIDTAGLRKKSKITEDIEYYSTVRTGRIIDECDIVLMMLDITKDFGKQDQDIIRNIISKGKGLVIVINKLDLVKNKQESMSNYINKIRYKYSSLKNYPFIFTSVKENKRVRDVISTALEVNNNRSLKIKTRDLNLWLADVIKANPPVAIKGKNLKIKFVSQIRICPPLFVFHTNHPKLFSVPYKRYLENQLRLKFGFLGVSIKISFRSK